MIPINYTVQGITADDSRNITMLLLWFPFAHESLYILISPRVYKADVFILSVSVQ